MVMSSVSGSGVICRHSTVDAPHDDLPSRIRLGGIESRSVSGDRDVKSRKGFGSEFQGRAHRPRAPRGAAHPFVVESRRVHRDSIVEFTGCIPEFGVVRARVRPGGPSVLSAAL